MTTQKCKLTDRLPGIINQLGLRSTFCGDYYQCQCPIHGSDNPNSLTIWTNGGWKCWTSNCNEEWGTQLDGLLRALGASPEALLAGVEYGQDYKEEEVDINLPVYNVTRDQIRECLQIPSKFYIDRGFSEDILNKFDVGDSFVKEMKNRAVFPIYNKDWGLIGCAGRTLIDKPYIPKWRFSKNFKSGSTFFGINHAWKRMKDTKRIILVEGMSDTMRMHEYGIENCAGALGSKLSRGQVKLLKEMGVTDIIVALDPDPPRERNGKVIEGTGPMRTKQIIKRYGKDFNITPIELKSDPDEMSLDEAQEVFGQYS